MLDKLIEPALKVYDKVSEGEEYSDIEREQARKGKSYLSNALNLLMISLVIFMLLSVWLLFTRPSRSDCDRRVEERNVEIDRLNRKIEKYENYLLPKMNEIEPKLEEMEKKTEKNESHFDKILNKAENAINR